MGEEEWRGGVESGFVDPPMHAQEVRSGIVSDNLNDGSSHGHGGEQGGPGLDESVDRIWSSRRLATLAAQHGWAWVSVSDSG